MYMAYTVSSFLVGARTSGSSHYSVHLQLKLYCIPHGTVHCMESALYPPLITICILFSLPGNPDSLADP